MKNAMRYMDNRFQEFSNLSYSSGVFKPGTVVPLFYKLSKAALNEKPRNFVSKAVFGSLFAVLTLLVAIPAFFSALVEIMTVIASFVGFLVCLPTTIVGVIMYRMIDRAFLALLRLVSGTKDEDHSFGEFFAKAVKIDRSRTIEP